MFVMKDVASSQTILLVLTSGPCPPHPIFAFPNFCFIRCALAGFFIVNERYCLNGSPDLYAFIISWGTVVLSNGFDRITPKVAAVKPRTKIAASRLSCKSIVS